MGQSRIRETCRKRREREGVCCAQTTRRRRGGIIVLNNDKFRGGQRQSKLAFLAPQTLIESFLDDSSDIARGKRAVIEIPISRISRCSSSVAAANPLCHGAIQYPSGREIKLGTGRTNLASRSPDIDYDVAYWCCLLYTSPSPRD